MTLQAARDASRWFSMLLVMTLVFVALKLAGGTRMPWWLVSSPMFVFAAYYTIYSIAYRAAIRASMDVSFAFAWFGGLTDRQRRED